MNFTDYTTANPALGVLSVDDLLTQNGLECGREGANGAPPQRVQPIDLNGYNSCNDPYKDTRAVLNATSAAVDFGYDPMATRAFEIQHSRAIENGQQWSEHHAFVFRELHQAYVLIGKGLDLGRMAWPLAVGTGKTQSLVAFALAQSSATIPLSLLVCIEKVGQIATLQRDMIAAGVPAHMIGVYHRKTDREVIEENLVASVALEDVGNYPFLLATHALMLRGHDNIKDVNTYQGSERSLVVWDESLIKSQGCHFDLADIEGALGVLRPLVAYSTSDADKDARDAVEFIGNCLGKLRDDFQRSLAGEPACVSEIPKLSAEDEMRYLTGIVESMKSGHALRGESRRRLVNFIEHVQRPVRVIPYLDGGKRIGVIHYLTRIPESLSRLVILDASHNIRLLTGKHDASVSTTLVDCRIKSFKAVSVNHYVQGAGREKLDMDLPRFTSPTVTRLLDALKSYPEDDSVLVVTFKATPSDAKQGKSHAKHVHRHMRKAGLNPDQRRADGRKRFVFLTWGQHVGVSEYAYCRHVLCVGVLRRDTFDIASHIAGQSDDLLTTYAADANEVRDVVLSEMFHNLSQVAGRGECRTTWNGEALPMTLTVLCNETFPASWWDEAMPDATIVEHLPTNRAREAKSIEDSGAVLAVLAALSPDNNHIALKTLKLAAGLKEMRPDAFSRLVSKLQPPGWTREGRSFVRCPFV